MAPWAYHHGMPENYSIVGQRQTTRLSAAGRFEPVMEVSFQAKGGTTGSVQIPLSVYSADQVHSRIAEYVAHIEAVESL